MTKRKWIAALVFSLTALIAGVLTDWKWTGGPVTDRAIERCTQKLTGEPIFLPNKLPDEVKPIRYDKAGAKSVCKAAHELEYLSLSGRIDKSYYKKWAENMEKERHSLPSGGPSSDGALAPSGAVESTGTSRP